MLVKVIGRALPNVGAVGTVREVSPQEARVLLALKRVEAYVPTEKPKRAYKRKDMEAEPVAVEPEPVAEPEAAEVEAADEDEGDEK
jgi:hypothetical protein